MDIRPEQSHKPAARLLIWRLVKVMIGLFIFAGGVYVSIRANVGLNPFDVFTMGISRQLSMSFGDAGVLVSAAVLAIVLLAKESIGPGTLLAVLIPAKGVDVYLAWDPLPMQTTLPMGFLFIAAGVTLMAIGQRIYIAQALGTGPRDLLLVALGKRLRKMPIGFVQTIIWGGVTFAGWLLGGSVGIGTLFAFFAIGPIMQLIFRIGHFDPRDVVNDTFKTVFAKKRID